MCGIAGCYNIKGSPVKNINSSLDAMNKLISHRGPDGDGKWIHDQNHIGLAHRRLAIIDLSDHAILYLTLIFCWEYPELANAVSVISIIYA